MLWNAPSRYLFIGKYSNWVGTLEHYMFATRWLCTFIIILIIQSLWTSVFSSANAQKYPLLFWEKGLGRPGPTQLGRSYLLLALASLCGIRAGSLPLACGCKGWWHRSSWLGPAGPGRWGWSSTGPASGHGPAPVAPAPWTCRWCWAWWQAAGGHHARDHGRPLCGPGPSFQRLPHWTASSRPCCTPASPSGTLQGMGHHEAGTVFSATSPRASSPHSLFSKHNHYSIPTLIYHGCRRSQIGSPRAICRPQHCIWIWDYLNKILISYQLQIRKFHITIEIGSPLTYGCEISYNKDSWHFCRLTMCQALWF